MIYPGSIERVDFGEVNDDKYFVIASIEKGQDTQVEWRRLEGRRFIDRSITIETSDNLMDQILTQLPPAGELEGAIMRLILDYPRMWDNLIDETALRHYTEPAFEFHLVRRPRMDVRLRLPGDGTISSMTPVDLLDIYWRTIKTSAADTADLQLLAQEIIRGSNGAAEEE